MKSVLKERYGLKEFKLQKLEGYDSINFKVSCGTSTYVLKQYTDTKITRSLLDSENAVLEVLGKLTEFDFPKVIPSKDKEFIGAKNGKLFRLLTYLEGDFLGDIEHSQKLLRSLGIF
ncbi:MAG: aminotransferase class III, partial [Pricia sp.]|nr:aminotransferase class III [Pricia sp.]